MELLFNRDNCESLKKAVRLCIVIEKLSSAMILFMKNILMVRGGVLLLVVKLRG